MSLYPLESDTCYQLWDVQLTNLAGSANDGAAGVAGGSARIEH
jgi:hypothetical protein